METSHLTQSILDLTLEVISLLTGEAFAAVKSGDLVAIMAPQHHFMMPKTTNEQRLLELINNITELLTGERGSRSDFNIIIKEETEEEDAGMLKLEYLEGHKELYKAAMMEEEYGEDTGMVGLQHLEGHKELYEAAMMEGQPEETFISCKGESSTEAPPRSRPHLMYPVCVFPTNGSKKRNPVERSPRPLYSLDSSREDRKTPHHDQAENLRKFNIQIKREMKVEEDAADRSKYLEGRKRTAMKHRAPLKIPADNPDSCNTSEEQPVSSQKDPAEDKNIQKYSPEVNFHLDRNLTHVESLTHPERSSGDSNMDAQSCDIESDPSHSEDSSLHSNNKRFQCSKCDKSFRFKSHLTSHQKTHMGPFSCSDCGKSFSRKEALHNHLISHATERPFSCCECGQRFKRKWHLLAHQSVHSSETPFSCSECGKSYKWIDALMKHQRIHTGVGPFTCLECGKSFTQKDSLNRHQRSHKGAQLSFSQKASLDRRRKPHLNQSSNPGEVALTASLRKPHLNQSSNPGEVTLTASLQKHHLNQSLNPGEVTLMTSLQTHQLSQSLNPGEVALTASVRKHYLDQGSNHGEVAQTSRHFCEHAAEVFT